MSLCREADAPHGFCETSIRITKSRSFRETQTGSTRPDWRDRPFRTSAWRRVKSPEKGGHVLVGAAGETLLGISQQLVEATGQYGAREGKEP